MGRRVHPKSAGAAGYFEAQIAAVAKHAPAALRAGDPHAIHQARVATRRLKALLELAASVVGNNRALEHLSDFGKSLRRRLGALRDLDVLRDLLQGERSAGAKWLHQQFERERAKQLSKARAKLSAKSIAGEVSRAKPIGKHMQKLAPAISVAVREASHLRLDAFATLASNSRADLHELRIAGKLLRYTLEIAQADGASIAPAVVSSFKSMQDDLGNWHDRVVLATRAAEAIASHELALSNGAVARDLAKLIDRQVRRAERDVAKFRRHWAARSDGIATALRKAMPLTRDVAK